jgi:hypothetical protein
MLQECVIVPEQLLRYRPSGAADTTQIAIGGMMRLINVPDISPKDDAFTCLETQERLEWVRLSGLPSNALERNVKALRLSRYRAAMQAAIEVRHRDVVISHLPLMSTAVALTLRIMNRRARHIAWAFNFTAIPTGPRLRLMAKSLDSVERFIVFSDYERILYPKIFGLDGSKFSKVMWAQDCPSVDSKFSLAIQRPYVCAIGGEGRDIDLVIRSAERFAKDLDFVIITRSYVAPQVAIPENVHIIIDLPPEKTWAIAKNGLGVLVPLISNDTCCGHITIVSAKLLGLPLVTTRSIATDEYVAGRKSILRSTAGDLDDFCEQIHDLIKRQIELKEVAIADRNAESLIHSRRLWSELLNEILLDG